MTEKQASSFLFSEAVENTNIMKAITLADVSKCVGDGRVSASVGRLHTLLMSLRDVELRSVREAIPFSLAVVSPWDAPIEILSDALDDISADQPAPMLAPFTGCPPGKALIQNAVSVMEGCATERVAMEHITAGERLMNLAKGSQMDVVPL